MLSIEGLAKRYAGVQALQNLSLQVPAGTIVGVIGPNGAGKTTLFNLISGLDRPDAGRIILAGEDVTGRGLRHLATRGVARTFQNIRLFRHLPVLETVLLGQARHTTTGLRSLLPRRNGAAERALRAEALELLAFLRLDHVAHRLGGALSYGEQRRLELARALASRPRLLLLDEPAAGMSAAETDELGRDIVQIRARGCTVLLIEHHLRMVMSVCDRVAVLDFGQKIAEGTPAAIQRDAAVSAAYLGREAG